MTPKEAYDLKIKKLDEEFAKITEPALKERNTALQGFKTTWQAAKKGLNAAYEKQKLQAQKKYLDATKEKQLERDRAAADAWVEFRQRERGQ